MRRIRRTLSPSDIKLSTAKIRKISIPPNFSAEKFKKYPEKHNSLPYKYRASESRAKLVPAMPSEADIQYSTRIKFTKILPHTQTFRFPFLPHSSVYFPHSPHHQPVHLPQRVLTALLAHSHQTQGMHLPELGKAQTLLARQTHPHYLQHIFRRRLPVDIHPAQHANHVLLLYRIAHLLALYK